MGKVDERFASLEGFIEELSIEADKSSAKLEATDGFMTAISKMELKTKQDYEIYIHSLKEMNSNQMQFFRDKVEIIRKVSPETGNFLEAELLKSEKFVLELIRMVEKTSESENLIIEKPDEVMNHVQQMVKQVGHMSMLVTVTGHLLDDVLNFLRS